MGRPWAGYTRVSRVGDRRETLISPGLQANRITHYATGRGIDVELLDPELDQSGGKVERPILSDAIRGVEEGRFAGIIVAQLDRLSRMDVADALATIRRIENAGGQVIAVAENFDVGTPEGRMARNVLLSLGEMQLDRYRRQFADAKRSAVERGVWPVWSVPLGYTVRRRRDGGDGQLHPDPVARAVVARAFEARAAGKPWREVAGILRVGSSAAGKIVRNRVYLGELRIGEWLNARAHEPIVARDLFEAAQLDFPRPARRGHPALLTGLVRCAACGFALTPSSSRKHGREERIYRCSPHNKAGRSCRAPAIIAQGKLDRYVEALALREIEDLAVSAKQRHAGLERALVDLAEAEAELVAYQQAVAVAELGAEVFAAGMRSRTEAIEEARRAVGEARLAARPVPAPSTLRELWGGLDVEERRHVLRGALAAVFVAKGSGPCETRVRVVAAGFPIPDRPGRDLEGEIGPPPAEHAL